MRFYISRSYRYIIMTKLTDKEFNRLWEGIDHRQGGQGDSPYTQEFVDELFGNNKKEKKKKKKGKKRSVSD